MRRAFRTKNATAAAAVVAPTRQSRKKRTTAHASDGIFVAHPLTCDGCNSETVPARNRTHVPMKECHKGKWASRQR